MAPSTPQTNDNQEEKQREEFPAAIHEPGWTTVTGGQGLRGAQEKELWALMAETTEGSAPQQAPRQASHSPVPMWMVTQGLMCSQLKPTKELGLQDVPFVKSTSIWTHCCPQLHLWVFSLQEVMLSP